MEVRLIVYLNSVQKYEKVENVNTQNDYKITSKKWSDKKKPDLFFKFVNVFKFQEDKFKTVQTKFLGNKNNINQKKDFFEK